MAPPNTPVVDKPSGCIVAARRVVRQSVLFHGITYPVITKDDLAVVKLKLKKRLEFAREAEKLAGVVDRSDPAIVRISERTDALHTAQIAQGLSAQPVALMRRQLAPCPNDAAASDCTAAAIQGPARLRNG